MCQIIHEPNKILRQIAKEISLEKITAPETVRVINDMKTALHGEPDGVAIAAPQIAESVRIFVVAGFVFDLKKKNKGGTPSPDRAFINPVITKSSKEMSVSDGEGCLSVRWIYGTTRRHKSVTVKAYDENGKPFTMAATGFLAQVFQHEIDHLNGILFIDHAEKTRKMTNEEIRDYQIELEALRQTRA